MIVYMKTLKLWDKNRRVIKQDTYRGTNRKQWITKVKLMEVRLQFCAAKDIGIIPYAESSHSEYGGMGANVLGLSLSKRMYTTV